MKLLLWMLAAGLTAAAVGAAGNEKAELLEVRRIWNTGEHNAFTDLLRFQDRWWCCFRESADHVGGDGKIRILTSRDGNEWESAALLAEPDVDLRDPKFSLTPDGRLMLVAGGSVYLGTKELKSRQPRVMFSADGRTWTAPRRILAEGDWLWRVTWHNGTAYGAAYHNGEAGKTDPEWTLTLYRSENGLEWQRVTAMNVPGRPNETTLRFRKDGKMIALIRREAGNTFGWIGTAAPPYREWTWHETDQRLGGPNFIELPDGSLLAGTRHYGPPHTTVVAKMDETSLKPLLTLPSGGDNSYPGMVWHEGTLWLSYYSSHEGKTSIYLAKVRLPSTPAK